MDQSRSARFRELLEKPPFVCLGAHDAVTADEAIAQLGKPLIAGVNGDAHARHLRCIS